MKTKTIILSYFPAVLVAIAALSVATPAPAQNTPAGKSSSLSEKDRTFMRKAAKAAMEVAMGKWPNRTPK